MGNCLPARLNLAALNSRKARVPMKPPRPEEMARSRAFSRALPLEEESFK